MVLFGTGCFKFNEPGVSQNLKWVGHIREKKTNKPIPNATIYLYRSYSIIDTFYAQKDGSFSFTYFDDVDDLYLISAEASNYYRSILHSALGTRTTPHVDIELDPYAWIKFHVKNVNPYDDTDEILVNNLKSLVGTNVDTFLVEESIGNTKFYISTWYYKNKIKTVLLDSIANLTPHDTTYFEIKY